MTSNVTKNHHVKSGGDLLTDKWANEHHPLANPPPPLMGDVIFGQALTKETINVVISAAKGYVL